MPIYAYKCSACGFAKDQLQKMSDPPLSECPSCGKPSYNKQLTAAGFQLKGSGWYATDFKGGSTASPATSDGATADAAAPAKSTDAAPSTSASACAPSCACH
jgi:putative FmdB family regulatory protein